MDENPHDDPNACIPLAAAVKSSGKLRRRRRSRAFSATEDLVVIERRWIVGRSHSRRRYSWVPSACALAFIACDHRPASAHHAYGALLPKTTVAARAYQAENLAVLPASVDLTPWTVPVGDQGQLGACVAWTIVHDLMGWYARRQGISPTLFAPMYLYSQNHALEPRGGMYTGEGFQAVSQQGNDTEIDYTQGDYDYWDTPTPAERANAAHYRISGYSTLFSTGGDGVGPAGQAAIQNALAASQPVAIGLVVRTGFEYLGYGQVDTDTTSSVYGYHEVLAVGYDDTGLKIQNHWATGVGNEWLRCPILGRGQARCLRGACGDFGRGVRGIDPHADEASIPGGYPRTAVGIDRGPRRLHVEDHQPERLAQRRSWPSSTTSCSRMDSRHRRDEAKAQGLDDEEKPLGKLPVLTKT